MRPVKPVVIPSFAFDTRPPLKAPREDSVLAGINRYYQHDTRKAKRRAAMRLRLRRGRS
jgi:hypothetical protein